MTATFPLIITMARCAGKTSTGRRCKSNAMAGRKYCWSHSPSNTSRSRGRAATKKKRAAGTKVVDVGSCRPKTQLGRPSRKLAGDMVIPTAREYAAQFPEAERRAKIAEYELMSGCELAKLARHKVYSKNRPTAEERMQAMD